MEKQLRCPYQDLDVRKQVVLQNGLQHGRSRPGSLFLAFLTRHGGLSNEVLVVGKHSVESSGDLSSRSDSGIGVQPPKMKNANSILSNC